MLSLSNVTRFVSASVAQAGRGERTPRVDAKSGRDDLRGVGA
jgi:hypothetical protein